MLAFDINFKHPSVVLCRFRLPGKTPQNDEDVVDVVLAAEAAHVAGLQLLSWTRNLISIIMMTTQTENSTLARFPRTNSLGTLFAAEALISRSQNSFGGGTSFEKLEKSHGRTCIRQITMRISQATCGSYETLLFLRECIGFLPPRENFITLMLDA